MTWDPAGDLPGDALDGARALTAALDAQRGIYGSMLELTHREEAAIVAGDVAALTRIVEEKEQLIEHLHALETERMTAIVAIAQATGIDLDEATISEIAAHLPREAALMLTECGIQLRARAISLREANERNARLLRGSRELVDRWIQYLRTMLGGTIYSAGGATSGTVPGGRSLDRSA